MIETASNVVSALKSSPVTLALVVINTLFLAMTVYLLQEISSAGERRDALIGDLIQSCFQQLQQK